MLFNSLAFALFLPSVFILYWYVIGGNLRLQNAFLVVASYVFYGWWDWRFLTLICISSLADYLIGLRLFHEQVSARRRELLIASLAINLGILGLFKYYNFFAQSLAGALGDFGIVLDELTLLIVLPVGISFYTFQTLSYTLDIYHRRMEPTRDAVAFFAFVSFFPQLVAGPIERARNLLPQFLGPRRFDYDAASDGMRQILWGLFKKVVIADTCAVQVDYIFRNSADMSGSTLVVGSLLFAFQIYGDFSGYSDIAIGTARLFGFKLMRNFANPYFSRSIGEFWHRWHISLSTWFRDYVYIPLGGSFGTKLFRIRNILITFTVSGLWHGANWTFVVWGFIHGLYYLPTILFGKGRPSTEIVAQDTMLPSAREALQVGTTFLVTLVAWVFFRAESVPHAISYLGGVLSSSLFEVPAVSLTPLILILVLVCVEWIQRRESHGLVLRELRTGARWTIYLVLAYSILLFFKRGQDFIYFQF